MFKGLNSKKQGDIGLGHAISYYCKLGTVCLPLTDSQDYDLIVDIDGKLHKVQVKTSGAQRDNKGYQITLVTKGGNKSGTGKDKPFDCTKVDFLFILTGDGKEYSIPSSKIDSKIQITVGNQKYNEFVVAAEWDQTQTVNLVPYG